MAQKIEVKNIEANIKISRGDRNIFVSVEIPIWNKPSKDGNIFVSIPFLGIETIAANENDTEAAINEVICSFCIVSEKFGQGIEKELQELGWTLILDDEGDPVWGYSISEPLDRIIKTGDNFVNPHLELQDCDS